jgi:RNA polymerase sigma factor (sigma-70 family)
MEKLLMDVQIDRSPAVFDQHMDLNDEATWNELYTSLRILARYLVYSYHVSVWRGQEEDVVEDIVQETVRRLLERIRKAERGEAHPVYAVKHMMTVIAQNYCRDLRRRERRLLHFPAQDKETGTLFGEQEPTATPEDVTESMYQEWVLTTVAQKIARFPAKQRQAILVDLAHHMSFDGHPTPLQKAFLQVGIDLEAYKSLLPTDSREYGRYLSLRTLAYKRVARFFVSLRMT